MRIQLGSSEFFLCVISAGRPEQVPLMHDQIGSEVSWIVPYDEWEGYEIRGANSIYGDEGNNVSAARNVALEAAFEQDLPCLMLDDDLIDSNVYIEPNSLEKIHFNQAALLLEAALDSTDFKLAATTHVTNPLFLKHGISIKSTINGGCLLVKPNPLRFEESIRLSEDVDYALQHIVRYGGAVRSNDVVLRFKRRAPGGVQSYRNEEERNKSVEQLMHRWPGIITRSKKDPNHPVLRFPRKRSVLQ